MPRLRSSAGWGVVLCLRGWGRVCERKPRPVGAHPGTEGRSHIPYRSHTPQRPRAFRRAGASRLPSSGKAIAGSHPTETHRQARSRSPARAGGEQDFRPVAGLTSAKSNGEGEVKSTHALGHDPGAPWPAGLGLPPSLPAHMTDADPEARFPSAMAPGLSPEWPPRPDWLLVAAKPRSLSSLAGPGPPTPLAAKRDS